MARDIAVESLKRVSIVVVSRRCIHHGRPLLFAYVGGRGFGSVQILWALAAAEVKALTPPSFAG